MKRYVKFLLLFISTFSIAQVGINTTNPSSSSALDIVDTGKGILIPRVSLSSTSDQSPIPISVTPQEALLIYNNAVVNDVTKGFYYWSGTKWVKLLDTADNKSYTTPWFDYDTGAATAVNTDEIYMSGNINIGTKKDLGPITVLTEDGEVPVAHFTIFENARNSGWDLDLVRNRGVNYSGIAPLQNGDLLGTTEWKGVTQVVGGNPVFGSFAKIQAVVDGTTGAGDLPSRLEFYTTPSGSTTPELVMEILNDGKLHFPKHTNWVTSSSSSDPAIAVKSNGELVKIAQSVLRTAPLNIGLINNEVYQLENIYSNDRTNFVKINSDSLFYNKPIQTDNIDNIVVGTLMSKEDANVHIVKKVNDLSPLLLSKVPLFKNNEDAIKAGLKEGMIYKDYKGNLMIVF